MNASHRARIRGASAPAAAMRACCAMLALGMAARAQGAAGGDPTLEELARRNAELEARVASLEEGSLAGEGLLDDPFLARGLVAGFGDVTATFQLFGDVGFRYANPEPGDRSNGSFTFGALDLFVSAQMGDHFQVLTESVLTGKDTASHFEQERIWGAWTFSDRFYAKLGLEHSPISHWNRVYHHGAWLELTIERPLLARFEGDPEGFLPLHNSGLEVGGRAETGAGRLDYTAVLSNGRGTTPTDKQRVSDANDDKAVVLALSFAPDALPALRFGAAGHFDDIAAQRGAGDPALRRPIEQTVASAWAALDAGPLEVLAEVASMEDETRADGERYGHAAGYLQIAWPCGELTPYLRFDRKDMEAGDPFLAQSDRDLDRWQQILGVRYDFASRAALKVEVGYGQEDVRDAGGRIDEENFVTAGFQVSWSI